jgi:hypothetical protein
MNLTRKERITAYIAKWIVLNIACRINATAVLSLSMEVVRIYIGKQNAS